MTTLVVDGNNILARSAFAAKGSRAHMSVDGVNTAALTIFINMLSKYVKQVSPTHMAVCWDAGHRIRDEIYPEYKAKRAKHVEEIHGEFTAIDAGLSRLQAGDLCLILIDQVEEALAHIKQRIAEAG